MKEKFAALLGNLDYNFFIRKICVNYDCYILRMLLFLLIKEWGYNDTC